MKTKTKLILITALLLLFLVTSFGQAKAATYYENSGKIVSGLDKYIYQPTVDLIKFTGNHLALTFKSFPPFVIATKGYFKGIAYLGEKVEKSLGTLFFKTGNFLAVIPQNLPDLSEVSRDSADFFVSGISVFKDSGQIFKISGDTLAVIPNNLPNLEEVSVDVGNFFISIGDKVHKSVVISVTFFNETFNNLTNTPRKQSYPYTQKLLTKVKNNLEYNFIDKVIGIQTAKGSKSPNLYAPK